jgi:hypothetical protein
VHGQFSIPMATGVGPEFLSIMGFPARLPSSSVEESTCRVQPSEGGLCLDIGLGMSTIPNLYSLPRFFLLTPGYRSLFL